MGPTPRDWSVVTGWRCPASGRRYSMGCPGLRMRRASSQDGLIQARTSNSRSGAKVTITPRRVGHQAKTVGPLRGGPSPRGPKNGRKSPARRDPQGDPACSFETDEVASSDGSSRGLPLQRRGQAAPCRAAVALRPRSSCASASVHVARADHRTRAAGTRIGDGVPLMPIKLAILPPRVMRWTSSAVVAVERLGWAATSA